MNNQTVNLYIFPVAAPPSLISISLSTYESQFNLLVIPRDLMLQINDSKTLPNIRATKTLMLDS